MVYSAYGYCPDIRDRPIRELHMVIDRIAERNGWRRPGAPVDLSTIAAKYAERP